MTTTHKHQTILRGAAEEFHRTGTIRTFDAVYRWVCPDCGAPQRTTRLADTIYALRQAYGWVIETHAESGNLAVYTLTKAGDMPGDDRNGPHPRRLVRDEKAPDGFSYGRKGDEEARTILLRDAYQNGKPVPVEAIPSPTRWRCERCKTEFPYQIGQPQLGGYRKGICPVTGCGFIGGKAQQRIFIPVI